MKIYKHVRVFMYVSDFWRVGLFPRAFIPSSARAEAPSPVSAPLLAGQRYHRPEFCLFRRLGSKAESIQMNVTNT